ncbi:MAG: magnesium/cobalt transporter CorA [Candidatus Tectimicrobiota bacterium]
MVWQKNYGIRGSSPGTLTPPPNAASQSLVTAMHYTAESCTETQVHDLEAYLQTAPREGVLWVNVDGLGDVQTLETLGTHFGLHPLSLEDVLHIPQRAKLEDYEHYQFLVFHMAFLAPEALGETEQVSLFLGSSYVLTFQERLGSDLFDSVRQNLRHNRGRVRQYGSDYLAYALLDATIDGFFPILEDLGERLSDLEEAVLAHPTRETMEDIYAVRRTLLALRRVLWPLRQAVQNFSRDESGLVTDSTRLFLRDCYDHTLQVLDVLENYRELVAGLMETYLSSQSHHLNEVMKVLTIISTIFMPLSFIAGVYGMNFKTEISPWNMPELGWAFGYPFSLVLMALIAGAFLVFFWRKGWL